MGGLIGRASEEKAGLVYPDMFAFIRSCNDANNAVTFGLYRLNPSTNNVPSDTVFGDVLLVMPWDPNTVHQVIYKVNRQELKRVKSGGVWGEWI